MFDFEKLDLYQMLKRLTIDILKYLASNKHLDLELKDQLKRASLSALLNLSEGTGRMKPGDKKRFYEIARSSVFECVAILQILQETGQLSDTTYDDWYDKYTQSSKMLLSMYRSFDR